MKVVNSINDSISLLSYVFKLIDIKAFIAKRINVLIYIFDRYNVLINRLLIEMRV